MKNYFLFLFFFLLSFTLVAQQPIPGQLLLQTTTASEEKLANCLQDVLELDATVQLRPVSPRLQAWRLDFAPHRVQSSILENRVLSCPLVRGVSPNYDLTPRDQTPNDSYYENQWNLDIIQAPKVWDYTTGGVTPRGDTIVVAILDSGFDLEHEDLAETVWTNRLEENGVEGFDDDGNGKEDDLHGWNFIDDIPAHPQDSHGTAVSGILGAQGNNGLGISGVNWNVQWIPLTVSTVEQIVHAYGYILELRERYNQSGGSSGAFVVATNASIGIDKVFCADVPVWEAAYDPLGEAGVLSVAATANGEWDVEVEGDLPTTCPSEYLIGVTNTTREDEKFNAAAYGKQSIDLGAPGGPADQGVFSTDWFGGYEESFGGTSASAPHVAGAIALLYSLPSDQLGELARNDPAAAARLIRTALLESTDPLPSLDGLTVTGGRLNLFQSMWYLHGAFQDIVAEESPLNYTDRRRLIRIFPNPVASGTPVSVFFGTRELEPVQMRLFSAVGQLVYERQVESSLFENQAVELPTTGLPQGMYYLMLENGRSPITQKLMILR